MIELNLLQRLNYFRKKVGAVKKDGNNPHFKAKYATIESVIETIDKPLTECGIGYYQAFKKCEGLDYLCTTIYNVDKTDEQIENSVPLFLPSNDMQKLGSAITYARRYGLVSLFGLEQEDDDGNGSMPSKPYTPTKKPATSGEKAKIYSLDELRKQINNAKSVKQLNFLYYRITDQKFTNEVEKSLVDLCAIKKGEISKNEMGYACQEESSHYDAGDR